MADENKNEKAPIIVIKRITNAHGGHHGGAWKIAYADFVTAMMAFFLLMWLLNAVPSEKLHGIAEYFEPTIGIFGNEGIGFKGGNAQNNSGRSQYNKDQGVQYGVISKGSIVSIPQQGEQVYDEELENERFALVEGELKKVVLSDPDLAQFQDRLVLDVTPEGLRIRVTDQDEYPMFQQGSASLDTIGKNILSKIVKLIKYSPNFVSITGCTSAGDAPISNTYTDWELSTDRANAARRFMIEQGLSKEQVAMVVGKSDTDPVDTSNAQSARNRRIEIVLLRNSIKPFNKSANPLSPQGQ